MTATARKASIETVAARPGNVVPLGRSPASRIDFGRIAANLARNVVPPLIVLSVLLAIWQVSCSGANAPLPPPTQIWADSYDLIAYPFFDYGSQDIGLAWRVLISLQRVAIGFGLAAIAGVAIGALIGQSVWAMRGLDPIFQILRTVPPLA